MSKQNDNENAKASEPPVALSGDSMGPAAISASSTLEKHLSNHLSRRTSVPRMLAAELTTLVTVALPKGATRHRAQFLAFAIEDQIGVPIDTVSVVELPRPAAPGLSLLLVIDRAILADLAEGRLPEILALPRPETLQSWHVWRDDARVLVRLGDGTGFAARMDMLPMLWQRAGRPDLVCLHGDLDDLPHRVAAPPAPDPRELAYRVFSPATDPARQSWRPAMIAAAVTALALVLHLAIAAADVVALGRQAAEARAEAEMALAEVLPGIAVTPDTSAILSRLAPRSARPEGPDLVPALSDMSEALLASGVDASLRRLRWGDGRLVALVLTPGLEDLQTVERSLETAGFTVAAGAASAGDGGAEAEMTLQRGGS